MGDSQPQMQVLALSKVAVSTASPPAAQAAFAITAFREEATVFCPQPFSFFIFDSYWFLHPSFHMLSQSSLT